MHEEIMYDNVDMIVPVLIRVAAKRRIGYQATGCNIWVREISFPGR
jgi:hypothetical protein